MSEFKQTITIETERKTGETIIRISNPKFTTDEPTVRGAIIGDMTNNRRAENYFGRTLFTWLQILGL